MPIYVCRAMVNGGDVQGIGANYEEPNGGGQMVERQLVEKQITERQWCRGNGRETMLERQIVERFKWGRGNGGGASCRETHGGEPNGEEANGGDANGGAW
jgi:hypothetical protein